MVVVVHNKFPAGVQEVRLNSWLVGLAPGNGQHTNQLLKGVEKKIRLVQLVDARLLGLAGTEQLVLDACPIGLLG